MPIAPRGNEDKDAFLERCIPAEVDSGYPQDQAVAICYSKWREAKKGAVDKSIERLAKAIRGLDIPAMKAEDAVGVAEVVERALEAARAVRKAADAGPRVDYEAEVARGKRAEMAKGASARKAVEAAVKNLAGDPMYYRSLEAESARKARLAGQPGAAVQDTEPGEDTETISRQATTGSHGALVPESLEDEETDGADGREAS